MPGGQEAGQLLGEVLDHVVAFRLPVHQHIEAKAFLQGDHVRHLAAHPLGIGGLVELAAAELGPGRAHALGLRERPDRGRRQGRQVQAFLLQKSALRVGRQPVRLRRGDGRHPGPDDGVVGDRGRRPSSPDRLTGLQFGLDRIGSAAQTRGQGDGFGNLLAGEGEPSDDLRIQVRFQGDVEGDVQQRTGRGHHDLVGEPEESGQGDEGGAQVVDPDVAPVDHPCDQAFAGQTTGRGQLVEVAGSRPGEVEGDTLDRGPPQYRQGLAEHVKIGCYQELRPIGQLAEELVRPFGGGQDLGRLILDQRRLVQLHPLDAGGPEPGEGSGVDRKQVVEQRHRVEPGLGPGRGLGQAQERHRPDQHRPGPYPERGGLGELGQRLGQVQPERGGRTELGDEVVIVGIEPLGHLQRCDLGGAAGHREVPSQRRARVAGPDREQRPVPLRDRAEQADRVQHLVVQREVVDRNLVQTGVPQLLPGPAAQLTGLDQQLIGAQVPGPVPLGELLQGPVRADPRITEDRRRHGDRRIDGVVENAVCAGHVLSPRELAQGSTTHGGHGPAGRQRTQGGAVGSIQTIPRGRGSTTHVVRGAPAGLRTREHAPGDVRPAHLLAIASQTREPSACLTAVVLAHRCGAVPDSHRIPSCDAPPGG